MKKGFSLPWQLKKTQEQQQQKKTPEQQQPGPKASPRSSEGKGPAPTGTARKPRPTKDKAPIASSCSEGSHINSKDSPAAAVDLDPGSIINGSEELVGSRSSQSSTATDDVSSVSGTFEGPQAQSFSLKEIKRMTKNFAASALLGQGGYGPVYKGQLSDGQEVAIKILESENGQGQREWESEVRLLGRLEHPNLVRLLGYCCQGDSRDLVYELVENGSLEGWLFSRRKDPLPWDTRMRIALDAARALAFLHDAPGGAIIFRDLKPDNILLDADFNAKLSDFGMAREGPEEGMSHVSTRIIGTNGYAAPEYVRTGHLTMKTDTFTFGVVLFEIITGRPTIDHTLPPEEQDLLSWILPRLATETDLNRLADPRLKGRVSMKALRRALSVAVNCVKPLDMRISMAEAVKFLAKVQGRFAREQQGAN